MYAGAVASGAMNGPRTLEELLAGRPAIAVGRQLEMMNVVFGFEQANQYVMYDPSTGAPIGYIMEEQQSSRFLTRLT
jgi:hypothetical protein